MLWEAQSAATAPDEQAYLACAKTNSGAETRPSARVTHINSHISLKLLRIGAEQPDSGPVIFPSGQRGNSSAKETTFDLWA